MMKRICVLAAVLMWTLPVMAETYSWVDESGTYNFTEDYSRVPKKYRGTVEKRGDLGVSAAPQESAKSATGRAPAPPATSKGSTDVHQQSPKGLIEGKTYDQWKQGFSEREAALGVIRKRIDEIDALLSKNPSPAVQSNLYSERNKATGQLTELRKQYDQYADKARKAGIQVDISQ